MALVWIAWLLPRYWLPNWPPSASDESWLVWLNLFVRLGGLGTAIYSQVYRYRHVSNVVQRQQTKWVVFGIVAALLVPRHRAEKPVAAAAIIGDYQTHKKLIGQLASRYPKLPRGARVIFLSDPYPADDYILYFIFALQYRDRDIRVDRVKVDPGLIAKTAGVEYAHVFNWGAAGLEEVAAIR